MASDNKPLKSALDLALERMDAPARRLTAEQKAALAEIDRQAKARQAELEILGRERLAAAQDDPEQLERLQAEQRAALDKIRRRAEEDKERIRRG